MSEWSLSQVLVLAGLVAAIAVLGGVAAGITIHWLVERDHRRPREDPRPTSYHMPSPPPPAPFVRPGPPSNNTRLELMRRDWVNPRRPG